MFLVYLSTLFQTTVVWIRCSLTFLIPRRFRLTDISDEVVLITGGGSGLGRELALKLLPLAKQVIIWDVDAQGLAGTRQLAIEQNNGLGNNLATYQVNVTNAQEVRTAAERVIKHHGPVTVLINNAGIVNGKRLLELTDDEIRKVMDVNAVSHFWTLRAFLPAMIEHRRGHIVTVASMAGFFGMPQLTDYCASKFAAVGLTESIAAEYRFLKTMLVAPGAISTGLFAGFKAPFPELTPEYVADEIVIGIRTNQKLLMLPRSFYFMNFLKTVMPLPAAVTMADALGSQEAMAGFVGRQKKL